MLLHNFIRIVAMSSIMNSTHHNHGHQHHEHQHHGENAEDFEQVVTVHSYDVNFLMRIVVPVRCTAMNGYKMASERFKASYEQTCHGSESTPQRVSEYWTMLAGMGRSP